MGTSKKKRWAKRGLLNFKKMEFAWKVKEICLRTKLSLACRCWWSNELCTVREIIFLPVKIQKNVKNIFAGTFDFLEAKKTVKKRPLKKIEEDGRPKKKKDGLKNGLRKFKIEYLKKVKENVPRSQKYHPSVATGRPKKKKMGGRWAMCQNVPTK